jgi:magnesium-transporting ATPase (P-type)
MKRVDPIYLREWETALKSAEALIDASRNDQVARVSARIETNMKLVGVTAVEDRLQDGVPSAIQTVKDAGIRLWVLTGDKVETAVDIAFSCALFDGQTRLAYATYATSEKETLETLARAQRTLSNEVNGGLVMDGGTLTFALANPAACKMIYELGIACRSCVCCRLSPKQKRQLVQLVRKKNKMTITLAIGDGANDVPMIEGAHIGVGVRGKEGVQAVQVSDIAISQFRFLVPLLLCHGQRAYRRIAVFLCFFLYKNVALVLSDVLWSIQDDFQGRIAFPEWLSMGYNAIFTSWHILFALGWDKGVPDHVANCHPELYADGPLRRQFNPLTFFLWMCYAILHGTVAWLVPNYWYGSREYTDGPSDFWKSACASFLLICVIVNLKLLLNCYNPFTAPALASTAASIILAVLTFLILGETALGDLLGSSDMMKGLPSGLASTWQAWLSLLVVPTIALCIDVVEKAARSLCCPSEMAKLRLAGQSAQTQVVTLTVQRNENAGH